MKLQTGLVWSYTKPKLKLAFLIHNFIQITVLSLQLLTFIAQFFRWNNAQKEIKKGNQLCPKTVYSSSQP